VQVPETPSAFHRYELQSIVAVSVSNEDGSTVGINRCNTAQLQPPLLRLSAMPQRNHHNTQTGHIEIREVDIVLLPHPGFSNGQIQLRRQLTL
jgi:hypothetical protein